MLSSLTWSLKLQKLFLGATLYWNLIRKCIYHMVVITPFLSSQVVQEYFVWSTVLKGCPGDSVVKNLIAMQEMWVQSLGEEDPLEKGRPPTAVSLPWESHGYRSMVGYSPWGCKQLDMIEHSTFLKLGWQVFLSSLFFFQFYFYHWLFLSFIILLKCSYVCVCVYIYIY